MSTVHDNDPAPNFDGITERHGQRPPTYFMVLFLGLIVWGVIFIAYFLLSGWSSQAEFQQKMAAHQQQVESVAPVATKTPTAVATTGAEAAELYAQNCAVCHGATGKGGIGPDLTVTNYKYGRTQGDVIVSLSEGRSGGMPAFGTQLSKDQVAALADYVLSLK